MGGVYHGLGEGLSHPRAQVRVKSLVKITNAMQLTHNINNSGTFIPIGLICREIYQPVYFLPIMRSPEQGL